MTIKELKGPTRWYWALQECGITHKMELPITTMFEVELMIQEALGDEAYEN